MCRIKLQCNYQDEPIGVNCDNIILSFKVSKKVMFDSFEINCASTKAELKTGENNLWKYLSKATNCLLTEYNGEVLGEAKLIFWQVKLYLNGKLVALGKSKFETGIKFSARWIESSLETKKEIIFRHLFSTKEKITKARLYICGLGFFEAKLNEKRIGNEYYTPILSDYEPRNYPNNPYITKGNSNYCEYKTYDILSLIKSGENILRVVVASGYYTGKEKAEIEGDGSFGKEKLIYEIWLTNSSGKTTRIQSSEDTYVAESNFRSDLFSGDTVDFTAPSPIYSKAKLSNNSVNRKLVGNFGIGDYVEKKVKPCSVRQNGSAIIYDFGENLSGSLSLIVKGEKGSEMTVRFAETAYDDGKLNFHTSEWSSSEKVSEQSNKYKLSGKIDKIEPLFSWKCYRYAEITCTKAFTVLKIETLFIHGRIKKDSKFKCSETILNDIYDKYIRTQLDNLHCGVLSDCPHREKLPYTGDFSQVAESLNYCFDATNYTEKFLIDIVNAQSDNGYIPNTAPSMGGGGGYAWGNAVMEVTNAIYALNGDKRYINLSQPAVKKWIEFYRLNRDEDGVIRTNGKKWTLGDWLAPEMTTFDVPLMNMLCYYRTLDLATNFATILERGETYAHEAKKVKDIINKNFYDREKRSYCSGTQGEDVLPLYYGVAEEKEISHLREKVSALYQNNGYHFDTGIVSTPILLNYLTKNGLSEVALKLMLNKTSPSYYKMMEGETTLCEHWSKKWTDYIYGNDKKIVKGGGDVSHCHPMFGSVVAWLFKYVAGMNLEKLGERILTFSPAYADTIEIFCCEKETRYGKISIRGGGKNRLTFDIEVPKMLTIKLCFSSKAKSLTVKGKAKTLHYINDNGRYAFDLCGGKWKIMEDK